MTDQVLWQDLANHAVSPPKQYIFWNSPVMRQDLARLTFRKKNHQHPLDKMCLLMWLIPLLFIYLWGGMPKPRQGGAKRKIEVKREP